MCPFLGPPPLGPKFDCPHVERRVCGYESRWVLGVGRDSSFVRKIKATLNMDARGVCMLWVVSVISGG